MPRSQTNTAPGRTHSVYRIYDEAGMLLYVGYTSRGHARQLEHIATKPWARDVAETHWEHYDSREDALAREKRLIRSHHPVHNVVHSTNTGETASIEYRLRAEQYDLLKTCRDSLQTLRSEFTRSTRDFEARISSWEKVHRALAHALRHSRPLNDAERGAISNALERLARMQGDDAPP